MGYITIPSNVLATQSSQPPGRATPKYVTDLMLQVSQLLRAELEELVSVARTTMEPIKPCDEKW